jgi:trk system potassium uptake protein TrkH
MSNIGFAISENKPNLVILYLILVIVGGSFFSTSSGLRFVKIYSLFKYSINQILSFSRPKNIFTNKLLFTKINFDFQEINKYFLTIIIFIISLFILTSLLSLSGIEFENSFKLSVLTLMNTVNSSIYGLSEFNFNDLNYFTKYTLIFFMVVGRIELLTILVIIKKFVFKN